VPNAVESPPNVGSFTDLGGSGSASRLHTMVGGFTTYAQRTVVIVDSEGDMAQYATGLIRSHEVPEEDVLRFKANLEDSNFSPAEMLEVLVHRAANPPDGRPAVTLVLPLSDVLAAHKERRERAREDPGLAGTLLKLAEDPKYGGPVTISKPDFARALADRYWKNSTRFRATSKRSRPCAAADRWWPLYSTGCSRCSWVRAGHSSFGLPERPPDRDSICVRGVMAWRVRGDRGQVPGSMTGAQSGGALAVSLCPTEACGSADVT
jgi:hypothetical protein